MDDLSCSQQHCRQERGYMALELPVAPAPAETTQKQAGRPSACPVTTNGPGGKRAAAHHEQRKSSWNGPRAVSPAQQQPGAVLSTQQCAARDERGDGRSPHYMGPMCSKAQDTSSTRWRSLCIQWLIAPKVGLLPHSTPKRLVQRREAVRRGGGFVSTGKSTSGLNSFLGVQKTPEGHWCQWETAAWPGRPGVCYWELCLSSLPTTTSLCLTLLPWPDKPL